MSTATNFNAIFHFYYLHNDTLWILSTIHPLSVPVRLSLSGYPLSLISFHHSKAVKSSMVTKSSCPIWEIKNFHGLQRSVNSNPYPLTLKAFLSVYFSSTGSWSPRAFTQSMAGNHSVSSQTGPTTYDRPCILKLVQKTFIYPRIFQHTMTLEKSLESFTKQKTL